MNFSKLYSHFLEARLTGRYITLDMLLPLLKEANDTVQFSIVGTSELGKDIPMFRLGTGKKVVLAWSQMHGNESTTTKAIFDFLKFCRQKVYFRSETDEFLTSYSFYIIPILNPDGAEAYTRVNSNGVDLNRDAQALSQRESNVLAAVFKNLNPQLCLNLHDQRSIYGFDSGLPATVSFLAPSANSEQNVTKSRAVAMKHIIAIYDCLQMYIPGQVGRYDDSFNANCVGDTFQMAGVPTILFEAGHTQDDYQREKTREYIFYALLQLFGFTMSSGRIFNVGDYEAIPQNKVNFKDVIIRNVKIQSTDGLLPISDQSKENLCDVAIQYEEKLHNGVIQFIPILDGIGDYSSFFGHKEISLEGHKILINSQRIIKVGEEVITIMKESDNSLIIFRT